MSKYYRHAVLVQWISNEPWDGDPDLAAINYEITDGESIGDVQILGANREITRDEAITAEISFGGDGTFVIRGEEEQ